MLHCINEKTIKISPFWTFSFIEFFIIVDFVLCFVFCIYGNNFCLNSLDILSEIRTLLDRSNLSNSEV